MSGETKKLYIDTRHRTEDSNSSSDFKITLKETINCAEKCRFALCDVAIPHSWRAIDKLCDIFYFTFHSDGSNNVKHMVAVQLIEQDYNGPQLASEIKDKLKRAIAVKYASQINVDIVEFDKKTGMISFRITSTLSGFKRKAATLKDLDDLEKNPIHQW